MCLGVPMPPQSHPDRYTIYLINTILGSGMSSRLFQEVREKRGLAYSVYTYLNLCRDAGTMVAYAGCDSAKFGEVSGLIMKEFERLGKDVSASELQSAKEQLKGGMLLGLETSENRMMKLARDEIYFGKPITVKDIVRDIDKVTLKGFRKSARSLLCPDKITAVAMGKVTPIETALRPQGACLEGLKSRTLLWYLLTGYLFLSLRGAKRRSNLCALEFLSQRIRRAFTEAG